MIEGEAAGWQLEVKSETGEPLGRGSRRALRRAAAEAARGRAARADSEDRPARGRRPSGRLAVPAGGTCCCSPRGDGSFFSRWLAGWLLAA